MDDWVIPVEVNIAPLQATYLSLAQAEPSCKQNSETKIIGHGIRELHDLVRFGDQIRVADLRLARFNGYRVAVDERVILIVDRFGGHATEMARRALSSYGSRHFIPDYISSTFLR